MNQRDFDQKLHRVADLLTGLSIWDADAALDQGKRLLWGCQFGGKKLSDLEFSPETLPESDPSVRIAKELSGHALDKISEVIEHVRMSAWLIAFPNATPDIFTARGPVQ